MHPLRLHRPGLAALALLVVMVVPSAAEPPGTACHASAVRFLAHCVCPLLTRCVAAEHAACEAQVLGAKEATFAGDFVPLQGWLASSNCTSCRCESTTFRPTNASAAISQPAITTAACLSRGLPAWRCRPIVFGIGRGKTGTTSTTWFARGCGLQAVQYKPQLQNHITKHLAPLERVRDLVGNSEFVCDQPVGELFAELAEVFPASRMLLTMRCAMGGGEGGAGINAAAVHLPPPALSIAFLYN